MNLEIGDLDSGNYRIITTDIQISANCFVFHSDNVSEDPGFFPVMYFLYLIITRIH